jgi:hypothetical protein
MLLTNNPPMGLIGDALYPAAQTPTMPAGAGLALLATSSIAQALAFGLGLAFLGDAGEWVRSLSRAAGGRTGLATWTFIAVEFGLIPWTFHDSMHAFIDPNSANYWWQLGTIEWVFHAGTALGIAVIAMYLYQVAMKPVVSAEAKAMPAAKKAANPATAR